MSDKVVLIQDPIKKDKLLVVGEKQVGYFTDSQLRHIIQQIDNKID